MIAVVLQTMGALQSEL